MVPVHTARRRHARGTKPALPSAGVDSALQLGVLGVVVSTLRRMAEMPRMRPVEDRQYIDPQPDKAGRSGVLLSLLIFALGAGTAALLGWLLPDDGGPSSWTSVVLLVVGGVVAIVVTRLQRHR